MDPRAIVRLEGLGQLKNPVTSSGIEHVTFRIGAYCLDQLPYRVDVCLFAWTGFILLGIKSILGFMELHSLYSSPSIIRMIKSRRMRLAG
jgi:hypothetical protein